MEGMNRGGARLSEDTRNDGEIHRPDHVNEWFLLFIIPHSASIHVHHPLDLHGVPKNECVVPSMYRLTFSSHLSTTTLFLKIPGAAWNATI